MAVENEAKGEIFGRSAAKEGTENGEPPATETKRTPAVAKGWVARRRWRWRGGEVEKEVGAVQALAIVSLPLSLTSFPRRLPLLGNIIIKTFFFFLPICDGVKM